MEKGQSIQPRLLEQLHIHMQKRKKDSLDMELTPFQRLIQNSSDLLNFQNFQKTRQKEIQVTLGLAMSF